jgi:addiction module HigA family antidote
MVYAAKRGKTCCPIHPGALLRDDIIPATGRTKAEIAGLLGISRQHLYDILQERKPVSPAIAVRLGKLFWRRRGHLDPDAGRLRYLACGANRGCPSHTDHQGKGRLGWRWIRSDSFACDQCLFVPQLAVS